MTDEYTTKHEEEEEDRNRGESRSIHSLSLSLSLSRSLARSLALFSLFLLCSLSLSREREEKIFSWEDISIWKSFIAFFGRTTKVREKKKRPRVIGRVSVRECVFSIH